MYWGFNPSLSTPANSNPTHVLISLATTMGAEAMIETGVNGAGMRNSPSKLSINRPYRLLLDEAKLSIG